MTDDSTAESRATIGDLVALAAFVALGLAGILRHEMWRDELEIWLIARDSVGLGDLLHNMGTQGHPALWYLLSFLVARVTRDPLGLQLLNLAVATGAAAIFLRRAPFDRTQRLLFCFGYWLLFEFTVVSRNYALLLLLGFAYCAVRSSAKRIDLRGALLLALLANTHLYGAIACMAILAYEKLEALRRRRIDLRWVTAIVVAGTGWTVAVLHTWVQYRAIGPGHLTTYRPTWDLPWIVRGVATLFRGFVPLPNPLDGATWNTNLLDLLPGASGTFVAAALAPAIAVACARALRGRPAVQVAFWVGAVLQLTITLFVWYGYNRHHGQLFLWFVLCCWLAASSGAEPARRRPPGTALTALLALQVLAGAFLWVQDFVRPFSHGKTVARYLAQPEHRDRTLAGSADYAMQSIVGYLDRPFHYPESGRTGTFLDWSAVRHPVSPDEALEDAVALALREGRPVTLVLTRPIRCMGIGDSVSSPVDRVRVTCLTAFTGALVRDENYLVYLVEPGG